MITEQESTPIIPYRVTISVRVTEALDEFARLAYERGDGPEFETAFSEFVRRLAIYPQFGDPLNDVNEYRGHIRIGIIPPLTMRYGVLEDERLVFVTALPVLMAMK
jgi:hypothetical protein